MLLVVENETDDDDQEISTIPVPNLDSVVLKKVIDYCQHHFHHPSEPIDRPMTKSFEQSVSDWDLKFVDIELKMIIQLITASNYLDIKGLMELTCARVASLIKGKSPEQIRSMFGIENDFTPEEEEKIREENKWCEEV